MPGEKRLVAYATVRGNIAPDAEELREHLKGLLPEYMIPRAFVVLEKLPLTPSGKLDRRSLPSPDLSAYVSHAYEPPRGEVEEVLAAIWQELLGLERVGRNDNFFELGGHSLIAVRMIANAQAHLGARITVSDLIRNPTIRSLAHAVLPQGASPMELVMQGIEQGAI
jgi:acyl carrier protein